MVAYWWKMTASSTNKMLVTELTEHSKQHRFHGSMIWELMIPYDLEKEKSACCVTIAESTDSVKHILTLFCVILITRGKEINQPMIHSITAGK